MKTLLFFVHSNPEW